MANSVSINYTRFKKRKFLCKKVSGEDNVAVKIIDEFTLKS